MRFFIILSIVLCILPDTSYAATEYATFESFYKESIGMSWAIAGGMLIIGVLTVWATGGAASPIVLKIGSWIGGTMGLSGIAATKAGLALMGGGSIASGGFGVIGGTALLSLALTFGTDITLDYTLGKAISHLLTHKSDFEL